MIQTHKILLVEDDPDINETVCSLLMMEGYEVTSCENGHCAWELIQQGETFDVLFTDIMMPKMDGFELIERVTSIRPWKDLKVLAATASTSIKMRLDPHVRCIAKPYDLDKILNTLKEVLCDDIQKLQK